MYRRIWTPFNSIKNDTNGTIHFYDSGSIIGILHNDIWVSYEIISRDLDISGRIIEIIKELPQDYVPFQVIHVESHPLYEFNQDRLMIPGWMVEVLPLKVEEQMKQAHQPQVKQAHQPQMKQAAPQVKQAAPQVKQVVQQVKQVAPQVKQAVQQVKQAAPQVKQAAQLAAPVQKQPFPPVQKQPPALQKPQSQPQKRLHAPEQHQQHSHTQPENNSYHMESQVLEPQHFPLVAPRPPPRPPPPVIPDYELEQPMTQLQASQPPSVKTAKKAKKGNEKRSLEPNQLPQAIVDVKSWTPLLQKEVVQQVPLPQLPAQHSSTQTLGPSPSQAASQYVSRKLKPSQRRGAQKKQNSLVPELTAPYSTNPA